MSEKRTQYLRKLDVITEIIIDRIVDVVDLSNDFGDSETLSEFNRLEQDLLGFRADLIDRMKS